MKYINRIAKALDSCVQSGNKSEWDKSDERTIDEADWAVDKLAWDRAVINDDYKKIESMIVTRPEFIDATNCYKQTPLHIAAGGGNDKVVELLLTVKPESAYALTKHGKSAVQLAIANECTSTIEIFLKKAPFDSVLEAFIIEGGEYLAKAEQLIAEYCTSPLSYLLKPLVAIIYEYSINPVTLQIEPPLNGASMVDNTPQVFPIGESNQGE